MFRNSKCIQLFGFDPIGSTEEEKQHAAKQLDLPQFIPIDKIEGENPLRIRRVNSLRAKIEEAKNDADGVGAY